MSDSGNGSRTATRWRFSAGTGSCADERSVGSAAVAGAGTLNRRPLTAAELRDLSEYLWQFTKYNNVGYAVLESGGSATASTLAHTLHIGVLARGGISSSCDRVDVIAWRHTLDTTTGTLQLEATTLWSFGARDTAGVVSLCAR